MTEQKKVSEGLHLAEYTVNEKDSWKSDRKQIIHAELVAGPIAQFAMQLAEHFAIVAGVPDGEDSSGQAKCRLMTPQEAVDRACEIAALSFDAFANRGWLLTTMLPENIVTAEAVEESKLLEAAVSESA